MAIITITKLTPDVTDARGLAFYIQTGNRDQTSVIERKEGSISGAHYHKGEIESKNPEKLILIKGVIELYVKDIDTGEEEKHELHENTAFEIPPRIYHEVRAKTDIILLEFNKKGEDYTGDTVIKENM
jgi:mannose-6-phosphate isomerase-like protein (cupin superfamily)